MKIWIFNILVAGALAYLFLGESEQTRVKGDLEWAKEKVETTIDKKPTTKAGKADRGNGLEQERRAEISAEPKPVVAPLKSEPEAVSEAKLKGRDVASAQSARDVSPKAKQKPVPTVTVEPLEAPQPALVAEKVSGDGKIARSEMVATGGARSRQDVAEVLPPLDDPEVARRRAIVLDTDEAGAREDISPDAQADVHVAAMTARDRRDALDALAEDMELMYADKASR